MDRIEWLLYKLEKDLTELKKLILNSPGEGNSSAAAAHKEDKCPKCAKIKLKEDEWYYCATCGQFNQRSKGEA